MSKVQYCTPKNGNGAVYKYQIFEKKGEGIEDGVYKNGQECFIKISGVKIHIPVGSYIVHYPPRHHQINGERTVFTEDEFNTLYKTCESTPEATRKIKVKNEKKPEEPKVEEKAPESREKPKKETKKNKKKK